MIIFYLISSSAIAFDEKCIQGIWWIPQKKMKVKIEKIDDKYYGTIIAVIPEYKDKLDSENKKFDLRKRKLFGTRVLNDLELQGERWNSGTYYDPQEGKVYKAILWINEKSPDRLNIRAYDKEGDTFSTSTEFVKVSGKEPHKQQDGELPLYYGY